MFVRATYDRELKTVHYFDQDNNETLYIGGSFAWRTNNPGNLMKPGGYVMDDAIGYAQRTASSKGSFVIFPDRAAGEQRHQQLLKDKYGDKTIKGMISAYAPSSENDTDGYIDFVTRKAGVSSDDIIGSLSKEKFNAVSAAMAKQEGYVAGIIKDLGKTIQVQLRDKINKPFAGQNIYLKSNEKNIALKTNENGELPWIYSGLLGRDISIYYRREEGEAERIGGFPSSTASSGYTFNAPYYLFSDRPRVHEAEDDMRPLVHIVRSGETLTSIANKYGTAVDVLVRKNGLTNSNKIYARQHLRIPSVEKGQQRTPSNLLPGREAGADAMVNSDKNAPTSGTNSARPHARGHSDAASIQAVARPGVTAVDHQRTQECHPLTLLSSSTLEPSGKRWCKRFLASVSLDDLVEPFRTNAKAFIDAMGSAGLSVRISTTFRPIERSYLMYYSSQIARGKQAPDTVPTWAGVNIDWAHRDEDGKPDLVQAKQAAQEMTDSYGIGTNPVGKPAKSNHNTRQAVDMTISGYTGKAGNEVLDFSGNVVVVKTFNDLKKVGSSYSVHHNLANDPPHWSVTGN